MTESGIFPNSIELPCDVEGDPHISTPCPECGNGTKCSPALCNRRRELHARLVQSVRLLDGDGSVVDMAAERAKRRGWRV